MTLTALRRITRLSQRGINKHVSSLDTRNQRRLENCMTEEVPLEYDMDDMVVHVR